MTDLSRLPALLAFGLASLVAVGCPSMPEPDPDPVVEDLPLFGPENRWWHTTVDQVPASDDGLALETGETMGDLFFLDQFGDRVQLHQFAGRVVVVDFFAAWCGPCVRAAPGLEAMAKRQDDDGVVVVSVMLENELFVRPTQEDLNRWVEAFDIEGPVVRLDADQYGDTWPVSITVFPSPYVFDHAMSNLGRFNPLPLFAVEAAAAGTPGDEEICGDGIDNNVDLAPDCHDDSCANAPECESANEAQATLVPCGGAERAKDVWTVEVEPGGASLRVDNVDAATALDPVVMLLPDPDADPARGYYLADDEATCSVAPVTGRCPVVFLGEGTHYLATYAYQADSCNDESLGEYVLSMTERATATLTRDDVVD